MRDRLLRLLLIMIRIKKEDSWEANARSVDLEEFSTGSISIPPGIVERSSQILSRLGGMENKMGICIRKENLQDINVFLAAMTRVKTTKRKCVFYVSCDDDEIINYLKEKTTFIVTSGNEKDERHFTSILPTNSGDLSDHEKFLLDILCLRQMDNIFCTPFNDYAFKMASVARRGAYIPHEEEVYVLSRAELASGRRVMAL